jgi:hypothetical protein
VRSTLALAACWLLLLGGPVATVAASVATTRTAGDYGALRLAALAGFAVGLLLLAAVTARAAGGSTTAG